MVPKVMAEDCTNAVELMNKQTVSSHLVNWMVLRMVWNVFAIQIIYMLVTYSQALANDPEIETVPLVEVLFRK